MTSPNVHPDLCCTPTCCTPTCCIPPRRLSVRTASTKPTLGKPLDALSAAPPSLVPILGGMETHEGMEPHEPGCVLYHCFAREPDCEEPAPDSECLRWSADGTSCEAPLCRYMDDKLLMLDQQMLTEGRRLSGAGATAVFSIIATQTFLLAGSRRSLRNWCNVVEQAVMSVFFASLVGAPITFSQALAGTTPQNPKRNVDFDCGAEFNGDYTAEEYGDWDGEAKPEHFLHADGKWHMYYCNSDGQGRWVVSSAPPVNGATTKDNSCFSTTTMSPMRAYWVTSKRVEPPRALACVCNLGTRAHPTVAHPTAAKCPNGRSPKQLVDRLTL